MNLPINREKLEALREIPRLPECPPLTPALTQTVTETVFIQSNPQPADILFVFGSSYGDKWGEVAELWKKGLAPKIYIAGGIGAESFTTGRILSHIIRDEFIRHGVSREAIIVDERSINTLQDATHGKELFLKDDIRHHRILFACKAPHSGRCLRTLKKVFPKSELFPFVYDFTKDGRTIRVQDWWMTEFGRNHVWGEYRRIEIYSKRGDIA